MADHEQRRQPTQRRKSDKPQGRKELTEQELPAGERGGPQADERACRRSATNSQPTVSTRKNANITVYDGTSTWNRMAPRFGRPPSPSYFETDPERSPLGHSWSARPTSWPGSRSC